ALTYLRRLLGQMRQVDTEEELERYERALTRDGMLSANGGTRRIRLVPSSEWVLGGRISSEEREALRAEVSEATRADGEARNGVRLAIEAANRVSSVLRDVTPERIRVSLDELRDAKRSLDATPDPTTIDLPSHLVELKRRVDTAKRAADDLERE